GRAPPRARPAARLRGRRAAGAARAIFSREPCKDLAPSHGSRCVSRSSPEREGDMRFWKRGDSEFGDELRANRPEPPNELIRAIVGRAPKRARHMTRRPLRIGIAGAITAA